jgi:phosphonoacetate hydrolase
VCDVLLGLDGVEYALTSEDAIQRFNLPIDRIGSILVLGSKNSVFGTVRKGEIEKVALHSHGSLHESPIPFILNRKVVVKCNIFNKDVFQILFGHHSV